MTIKELIAEVKILTSKVEELIKTYSNPSKISGLEADEIFIDELHKLALEDSIPNKIVCGASD